MNNLIEALRDIIGTPDFYITNGNYSNYWDYGAMLEYMCAVIILCICISSVFKFLRWLIK